MAGDNRISIRLKSDYYENYEIILTSLLEEELEKKYDLVVVSEVQDYLPKEWELIKRIAQRDVGMTRAKNTTYIIRSENTVKELVSKLEFVELED